MSSTDPKFSIYFDEETKDFTITGLTLDQILMLYDVSNIGMGQNINSHYDHIATNSKCYRSFLVIERIKKLGSTELKKEYSVFKRELYEELDETLQILESAVKKGKIKI
jgi:hypothetical protein